MPEPSGPSSPLRLDLADRAVIQPSAPFRFDATVAKPSHFPIACRRHEPGRYWQTLRWAGRILGVKLIDAGTVREPRLELELYAAGPLPPDVLGAVAAELRWRLDLQADLRLFGERFSRDPLLGPVLARLGGMRVSCSYSLYEFLAVATVLQNTTVRRSTQMMQALFSRFGTVTCFDGHDLFAFWTPADLAVVPETALRALKVGFRAKSLSRIAQSFRAGEIDEYVLRAQPRDAAAKELLRLYGIGPSSVWYVLFEVFHHYDAFDTVSPWEQKIFSRLLFGSELEPAEKILQATRERWGEWRMLAAHYIFEDLFRRHQEAEIDWLSPLIRL